MWININSKIFISTHRYHLNEIIIKKGLIKKNMKTNKVTYEMRNATQFNEIESKVFK